MICAAPYNSCKPDPSFAREQFALLDGEWEISFGGKDYKINVPYCPESELSGFCYTQLYDVEQEQNGLICYDRSEKFSREGMERIRRANSAQAAIEK